ncbi:unnamed protein product [Adineta steineri]|uniref:Arrestin C-terminal-like domain-containing protein n=1 Tax=Adineta steineri TaxID=433720 RepID=A0A815QWE6_9BILA|nr:unnamed protein product [Adineta steineri]CAF4007875.1 unnamed protein product [Adineta steineri]
MGCGASSAIVINLDRENGFFYAGEVVSGTVELHVKDARLKADEIDFKLLGIMGYSTTSTDPNRTATSSFNSNMDTNAEYRHVLFLLTKYVFAHPQGGVNDLTYSQGRYSWPFQFQLPDNIPPTLSLPKAYPHVQYSLQVAIDKAWYKRKLQETRYIGVFPHINLLQQPNLLKPTIFGNHNRKDIIIKGVLSKIGCVPGEFIDVKIEIENPQRVLIKQIHMSIIQSCQVERDSYSRKLATCVIPDLIQRRDERMEKTFEIMIPDSRLPPSFQFKGGIKKTGAVSISYNCKIEVNAEGLFTDFDIVIPITLGTDPKPQPST